MNSPSPEQQRRGHTVTGALVKSAAGCEGTIRGTLQNRNCVVPQRSGRGMGAGESWSRTLNNAGKFLEVNCNHENTQALC